MLFSLLGIAISGPLHFCGGHVCRFNLFLEDGATIRFFRLLRFFEEVVALHSFALRGLRIRVNGACPIGVGQEASIKRNVVRIYACPISSQRGIMTCDLRSTLPWVDRASFVVLCRNVALETTMLSDLTRQGTFCGQPSRTMQFGVIFRIVGYLYTPGLPIKCLIGHHRGTFRSGLPGRKGHSTIFLAGPSPDLFRHCHSLGLCSAR